MNLLEYPLNPNILYTYSSELYKKEEYEEAFKVLDKLLEFPMISVPLREQVISLWLLCVPYVINTYTSYPKDIVNMLSQKREKHGLITFTITTCKRLSLFVDTINSFLQCCTDIHLIDEWICVDDNSSQEDRDQMQKLYPFFTFYFKTREEKGHPESMNIIQKLVKTPYVFHMEDDWKFYVKRNYLTQCLEVLGDNPILGQCLLNKNYGELPENIDCPGGYPKITPSGLRYIIHEHTQNQDETNRFYRKYGGKPNCAYWPHYSFRPSLLRHKVWQKLGEFDTDVAHFEMVYAYKYRENGYISAFLDGIYCMHTGRLTSQKDDATKLNAYILNDEVQFGQKPKKSNKNLPTSAEEGTRGLFTYVINLDRRSDRWAKFVTLEEPKFLNYTRVSAIDGMKMIPTEQLQRIFDGNDYNMRRGMVGCAMSHISLYVNFVNEMSVKDIDMMCVLEDDVEFVPDFQNKFIHIINTTPPDWDLIYLGHHMWKKYITDETYDREKLPKAEKWDVKTSLRRSIGGTTGYLITKAGARKLLDFINKHGMTNGIDTVQQKSADVLNIYYCSPQLVYSTCYLPENPTDTDIQCDFTSLTIPIPVRLEKQMEFYRDYKVIRFEDKHKFVDYTQKEGQKDIAIYQGPDISEIKKTCIYPYYTLNDVIIFVVPKPTPIQLGSRWFDRLKRNGLYTVKEAIVYEKN